MATAAFLTRDSYLGETGRPLTLNRYGYCLGNPVCYVDPSGHWIYEEELEQLQAGHERMRQEALASGKTQDIPQLSEMTAFLSALHELESANATVEYALQYNYRGLLSREYVWVVEQMAEQRNQGYACEVFFVTEDQLTRLGWSGEGVKKSGLEEEGLEAFTIKLNRAMKKYEISNRTSISMFLASISMESKSGKWLTEKYNKGYFDHKTYGYNTRGAGLIQLTGSTQEEFLKYLANTLPEGSSERGEVQKYLDGFDTIEKVKSKGEPIKSRENEYNVTDFIANNYPIEASTWFWGVGKKTGLYFEGENLATKVIDNPNAKKTTVPLNEYIEKMEGAGDVKNLFLVSQYYVNSATWGSAKLQEIALLDHFVDMHKEIVGTGKNLKVSWWVDYAGDSKIANGWESRLGYWEKTQ